MEEDSTKPLSNVIRIDDERIQDHLGKIVRGSVEETLNALLEAEAARLCNAERYERTQALILGKDDLKILNLWSARIRRFVIDSPTLPPQQEVETPIAEAPALPCELLQANVQTVAILPTGFVLPGRNLKAGQPPGPALAKTMH